MVYKAGLTFDEALTRYVGEWGAGQKRAVFLASLLWLVSLLLASTETGVLLAFYCVARQVRKP